MSRRILIFLIFIITLLCACSAPCPIEGTWEGESHFGGHVYPAEAKISDSGDSVLMELKFSGRNESFVFDLSFSENKLFDENGKFSGIYENEEKLSCTYIDNSGSEISFDLWREGTGHKLDEPIINTVSQKDALGKYSGSISLFGCVPEDELSRAEVVSRFGDVSQNVSFAVSDKDCALSGLGEDILIPINFSEGYISGELIENETVYRIEGGFYFGISGKPAFAGIVTADIEGITAIYELKAEKGS